MNIKLYPASVQGKGAAETIVNGLKYFNQARNVDVIIVARGGGSLEDLWPFNEEITARAIYESNIPVISAVGHETDFTIADFVADLRAPTPSAAGELAVPELNELIWKLGNIRKKMCLLLTQKLELMKNKYYSLMNSKVLKNPYDVLQQKTLTVEKFESELISNITIKIKDDKLKLIKIASSLDALSPLKTLARGYSIIEDENKNVITSVKEIKKDDIVSIVLADGSKEAVVK